MKLFPYFLVLLWGQIILALPIDEKLPLRFLKVSQSKKTVLINRGIEDGLVEGDHAKFFLTTGVIARGVLVKGSPSRSVWSMYRLISPDDIVEEKVLNLKVANPVKLTEDVTKMFHEEDIPQRPPEGVVLADGADDIDKELTPEEAKELESLSLNSLRLTHRTWEFWGMLHFSGLTTTNNQGTTSEGTEGKKSSIEVFVGLEKYFMDYDMWYGRFSVGPFLHYSKQELVGFDGKIIDTTLLGAGAGLNWHFINPPLSIGKWIGLLTINGGMGIPTDSSQDNSTTGKTQQNSSQSFEGGRSLFYSAGAGFKYFFGQGFGMRMILDYYFRESVYQVAVSQNNEEREEDFVQTSEGPRVFFGLSYRF